MMKAAKGRLRCNDAEALNPMETCASNPGCPLIEVKRTAMLRR
jgi:hypothetical protein